MELSAVSRQHSAIMTKVRKRCNGWVKRDPKLTPDGPGRIRADRSCPVRDIIAVRRGVAQSGRAPAWGVGGRRFESDHPDQKNTKAVNKPIWAIVNSFYVWRVARAAGI